MLGSKVSQFIRKRYLVSQEDSTQMTVAVKPAVKQVVEAESKPKEKPKSKPGRKAKSKTANKQKSAEAPVFKKVFSPDPESLDYEKSSLGRMFGWWVNLDGKRVATLEYRCLLEETVHLYSVNVLDEKFLQIDLDSEKWSRKNVTIQSRFASNYLRQGLSMAAVGQKMIVVEDLLIPEDYFRRQHKEIDTFHKELVDNANSDS